MFRRASEERVKQGAEDAEQGPVADAEEVELSREEAAILALYRELDGDAQREIQNVATEKKRLREVERQLKDLQADLAARRRSA
jgi:hypothetical protein